jgi:ribosomal protein S6--L-glutamate ligase
MEAAKNLVVVGGERFWHEYLPEWRVIYCRLQMSSWILEGNDLFISTGSGLARVDAVLWRVGVIAAEAWHRGVLDLIRLAGVPCVNAAATLQRGFDKLSMHAEMAEAGLPVIRGQVAVGPRSLELIRPHVPCVLKVGNFHGGLGKARALDTEQWNEVADLAAIVEDYKVIEPFIDYAADVRCLMVDENIWCLKRENSDWKVNRGVVSPELIEPPTALAEWTKKAGHHLGASVLGLDFLQTREGDWILLECNDVPGLTGFPDVTRQAVAGCLRRATMK